MTRFLSRALRAEEPYFRQGIHRLESVNGRPNHDIRLTSDILRASKQKIAELGLNPNTVTPHEVYEALQHRIYEDDQRLTKKLRTLAAREVSAEADVLEGIILAIKSLPESRHCFALKPTVIKSLIKKLPPKKTIKQFGYRSEASFIKHEQPVSMLAAAWLIEGPVWQKKLLDSYKKLAPSDFEDRPIKVEYMNSLKWQNIADKVVSDYKHNLLTLKEAGALIILPVKNRPHAGFSTVALCLSLHEINAIRAASTFLKMNVVRPDFGQLVGQLVADEPRLASEILDQPLPWQLIHRYYSSAADKFREELFEPHLQKQDMVWHPIESSLRQIDDSLTFWSNTAHLAHLAHSGPSDSKAVSINILDSAINMCNNLPYAKRVSDFFEKNLWHELMMRYMQHEPVENSLLANLQPQYVVEKVKA